MRTRHIHIPPNVYTRVAPGVLVLTEQPSGQWLYVGEEKTVSIEEDRAVYDADEAYDRTETAEPVEPHDHYHVVIDVYDGKQHIGRSVHHWHVDRDSDLIQGQTMTHSQTYKEPDGHTVMLAIQSEARRQTLD